MIAKIIRDDTVTFAGRPENYAVLAREFRNELDAAIKTGGCLMVATMHFTDSGEATIKVSTLGPREFIHSVVEQCIRKYGSPLGDP